MPNSARLLAIVSVLPANRVQCQNQGCGHGVYAAIHIVEDEGHLLVMGSTCFAKRYGDLKALGNPAYCAGSGGPLSAKDRETLVSNTAVLIEEIKARHEQAMEQANAKLLAIQERIAAARPARHPMFSAPAAPRAKLPDHPWPWQHRSFSSLGAVRAPAGQLWVRVQHRDGTHKIAPLPPFDGWEAALPASLGAPDAEIGAYSVTNVIAAMQELRELGFSAPEISRWPDVLKLVAANPLRAETTNTTHR